MQMVEHYRPILPVVFERMEELRQFARSFPGGKTHDERDDECSVPRAIGRDPSGKKP
jgi:hypothetical protein